MDQRAEQLLLVVDEEDRFLGRYVARGEAHRGGGERHRAFVLLVRDSDGRVLLQRRRHWLWDGLWDFSAVSHVLHLERGDETYEEAARRALKDEMGMEAARVERLGGFDYFADHGDGVGCENEYCAILVTGSEEAPHPNPEAVSAVRWLTPADLQAEVRAAPEAFTPWATLAVQTLAREGRWPRGV
jgi:isopentenyl-diphosphate delta-isomerase